MEEEARMKIEEVEKRLVEITSVAWDFEVAHGREDELWEEVLEAIAEGKAEDPAELASAALRSRDIEFPRSRA